jgi:hypothetical protein
MGALDTILMLWSSTPASAAADDSYIRAVSMNAGEVAVRLLRSFPATQIVDEISHFLAEIVAVMETDGVPDRRRVFLCSCCLELISDAHGIRVPVDLVQDIVRTFPISIWYRSVTRVVTAYLSRADLLEALIKGLSGDPHLAIVENCLQGFRMYAKFAHRDDDARRLATLRQQIAPLIDGYITDARVDIARYAERAKTAFPMYVP